MILSVCDVSIVFYLNKQQNACNITRWRLNNKYHCNVYAHEKIHTETRQKQEGVSKSIDSLNGPTTNKLKLCYLPKYDIRSVVQYKSKANRNMKQGWVWEWVAQR